ncbi:MAG: RagB/SusD family nutrient uptake outer membrane protein [Bacteroidota bacterium]|nr:RagB/SusD family nutrient uptake outer membrane protein [Bacteroidota bacterium]
MKHTPIKFIGTALLIMFLAGCSNILDEQPRAIYTPDYFKTQAGIMGGVTGMYQHLRQLYGNGYYLNHCETGTDEATWGASGDASNFAYHDLSGKGLLSPTQNDAGVLWGTAFTNINTASGVIENATALGTISAAIIAEARLFRAFDYFLLVQTFGGVPLDLGSGVLKFNTSTVRTSVRNTVPEVYTKAVFPDLLTALNDLPDAPRVTGGATKTAARLLLAKAYLTYAWWLENPKNIPTYPASTRTDPDGHNAQWYYQAAYDMATAGISGAGTNYALQTTYYDVNVGTNDYNKEAILYADHTQTSELYNGASLSYESGGNGANFAGWFLTWNYTAIASSKTNWSSKTVVNSVQREAVQSLGRPWVRLAPPIDVFTNTFADKTNDSRYDGTFTTVYRANFNKAGITNATLYNANNMLIAQGDAVLTFLDNEPTGTIDYSNTTFNSAVGAGVLPGRADYVISPSGISRLVYPGLWKLGPYRTDNGVGLGSPNAGSTRPFVVAKLSELYFLAAEAAVKGATIKAVAGTDGSARALINVIRARAGMWRWSNGGNVVKVQDNSAAMVAATPATIDVNYILAERSREYYGEGYRWYDLVRTQKWEEIAATYTICGKDLNDHKPVTVTRTDLLNDATHHYYLRPIPQGQIDNLDMTTEEKAAYQNPGYNQ